MLLGFFTHPFSEVRRSELLLKLCQLAIAQRMIARLQELELAFVFGDRFVVAALSIVTIAEPRVSTHDLKPLFARDEFLLQLDRRFGGGFGARVVAKKRM